MSIVPCGSLHKRPVPNGIGYTAKSLFNKMATYPSRYEQILISEAEEWILDLIFFFTFSVLSLILSFAYASVSLLHCFLLLIFTLLYYCQHLCAHCFEEHQG